MWCNDSRLHEELVECSTGAFVQIHVEANVSDLVRIDLQTALDRFITTLHLPVKRLRDNHVMMKVLVPQGCTCFSSTSFACMSEFQHWQATLLAAGSRAYPARDPDLKRLPKFRKLSLPKQFSHEQRNSVGPLIWKKNLKLTASLHLTNGSLGDDSASVWSSANSLLVSGRPMDRCSSSQSSGWKPRHDVMGVSQEGSPNWRKLCPLW